MIKRWENKMVSLKTVSEKEDNPRVITPESLGGLRASIDRFGYVDMIVFNQRTGNILSGHQRLSILKDKGVEKAMMKVVDMSTEEEDAACITMNNSEIEGEFDSPVIELMDKVEDFSPDLFTSLKMDKLRKKLENRVNLDGVKKDDKDWDTECPCCKNRWMVDGDDIKVFREGNKKEV